MVQGAEASSDIIRNIELTKNYDLDVLIVGRGGGSIEDLWCFNDEGVARAIYNLDVPVISAVGHEIDFTISDFVADLRAPTPTGAAEMAVPNITDVLNYLNQINIRSTNSITNIVKKKKDYLSSLMDSPIIRNPISIYEIKEQKFDNIYERLLVAQQKLIEKNKYVLEIQSKSLESNIVKYLTLNKHKYVNLLSKLEVLNPLLTLKRGYSIVKKEDKVISLKKDLNTGDKINIELQDGSVSATVE